MQSDQWFFAQNGRQSAPVQLEALRSLLQQGQLSPQDLVWTEGMTAWQPAFTIAQLSGVTPGTSGPSVPPPLRYPPPLGATGGPVALGYAAPPRPGMSTGGIGQDAGARWLLPVGRSGWAIAAGYLGLLSPLLVFAPLALITGIIAVRDMKKNPSRHGMGRAVFGIVMGAICTPIGLLMLASAFSSHGGSRGY